jgi:hypothetical protein
MVARSLIIMILVNGHAVRALVDSGSLGDLISTTIADQLQLKHDELTEPITLQLAVRGFRSKINHSTVVTCRYQDIDDEHTFHIANLSGYNMILGTSWLFVHQVSIGLNPARVCVRSAKPLPLEGVATAKIFAGALSVQEESLEAAREELLEYAVHMPCSICYTCFLSVRSHSRALRSSLNTCIARVPFTSNLLLCYTRFPVCSGSLSSRFKYLDFVPRASINNTTLSS